MGLQIVDSDPANCTTYDVMTLSSFTVNSCSFLRSFFFLECLQTEKLFLTKSIKSYNCSSR